jgi:PAS domain S-box-containing protein
MLTPDPAIAGDGSAQAASDLAMLAQWRERILRATGLAAEEILQGELNDRSFGVALRLLGEATGVSRVYIFRCHGGGDGKRLCSQLYEWCAADVVPQIDNAELQNLDLGGAGFKRWFEEFDANRAVYGRVADFPASEQPLLQSQSILALAAMPIFARGQLWGFIGFDDCERAHTWTEDVIGCLRVAAGVLGAACERVQFKHERESLLRHYEGLFENLNDVVFRAQLDGRWTFLSRGWERATGWSVAESLGRAWHDFVEPEDRARVATLVDQLALGGLTESRGEVQLRRSDGTARWVIVNVRRVGNEQGRAADLAGTITDIHEAKQTQLELQKARLDAEAANRAKSEFLSTMSHELRTPLNAVIGLTDSLLELAEPVDPARRQRYLKLIHQGGRQLLALINDILDVARIEAGRVTPEPVVLPIHSMCRAVVEQATPDAAARNVELGVDLPATPVRGWGDERLIRQVLQNLVGNAIKFTPAGGRVQLRAQHDDTGDVVLHVEDTGIGIAGDKLHLLFRPFSQLDSSLSRTYGGTGLGLTLVDRIVRLHGGQVRVASELGRGSTFTVLLPAPPIEQP